MANKVKNHPNAHESETLQELVRNEDQLINSMSICNEERANQTRDKINVTSNSNDVNSMRLKLFYADELVHVG